MKSMEDRLTELEDNPEKRGKAFSAIIAISYGMLFLGAIIIVAVLVYTYLL